jgi:hypothetical protein
MMVVWRRSRDLCQIQQDLARSSEDLIRSDEISLDLTKFS